MRISGCLDSAAEHFARDNIRVQKAENVSTRDAKHAWLGKFDGVFYLSGVPWNGIGTVWKKLLTGIVGHRHIFGYRAKV